MKPVLILGKGGQLSRALADIAGSQALVVGQQQADFAAPDFISQLQRATDGKNFSAVINAAAYTQVDKAEEEAELAMRVNGEAVGELAAWCHAQGLPLVHISSDYVFDGSGELPRSESDPVGPLSVYGKSKLAAEEAISKAGCNALIFRTSWLYDTHGKNFYTTMLHLFKEREELKVVSDQIGAPTYVPQLAQAIWDALQQAQTQPQFPAGIYHLCHGGQASWYDFSEAILALAKQHDSAIICRRIHPILSSEYPTAAVRPKNSRLDCSKAHAALRAQLGHWQEGLHECIGQTYEHNGMQTGGAENHSA